MKKKILFTIIGVLCIVIGMCVISTQAATYAGNCGDSVTYSLDTETGVLTISGTGAMADYTSSSSAPWYSNRSYIKSAVIEDSVTSIGDYAFSWCYRLTSIKIPNTVTSIGDSAFRACSGLTSIEIPDSVTSIGDRAFNYCDGLTSITIGGSVTSIGEGAFYYCTGLTSITIPDGVESIGHYAFEGCSGLTSVTIGGSVTSIGEGAFEGCSRLTSITIPDSVTSIGKSAFSGCYGLTSIMVEKENGYYCSVDGNLFNKDKTELVQYAVGKTNATYIIPDSVISVRGGSFKSCYSLTSIEIPDSVTSIGRYAFYKCYGLTSITIGGSVTSIGDSAFFDCYSLTSITIPDSVTSIGNNAFYYCYGLTSIEIPDSVTSIGYYAFDDCSGLTDVYYSGSEEEWNNISIRDGNEYLLNATIHYGVVVSEPERDYKVEKLTGEVKNGTFYAEAEITKNSNRNEKDMIVIAVYKDSIMIDMVYMKANLLEGQTVSFGGILTGGEDVTLKAFVWDSMTDMNALSNVIEQ